MFTYGVAESHYGFVALADDQSTRGRLFVSHRDRTVVGRPTRAIARIKRVVHLASEVVEAEPVKPLGVVSSEPAECVPLVLSQVRVVGNGLGRKVVGSI